MKYYTDQEIEEAIRDAADNGSVGIVMSDRIGAILQQEIDSIRRVLNALPGKQDDWQECTGTEIRPGETFRAIYHNGTVIEAEALHIQLGHISIAKNRALGAVAFDDVARFYRIPSPVQRPDPAVHPVIVVYDDTGPEEPRSARTMVWFMGSYVGGTASLKPENITDWLPVNVAKVIHDDT